MVGAIGFESLIKRRFNNIQSTDGTQEHCNTVVNDIDSTHVQFKFRENTKYTMTPMHEQYLKSSTRSLIRDKNRMR